MKKLIMALAIVLSLSLVGCSSESEVKDIPIDEIKTVVNTETLLPAQPVAEMPASEYYVFESVKDKFSEGFTLKALMSTNLQDVFVLKANSADDVESIKAAIEEYKNSSDFKMFADGYGNPDNINIAANSILNSKGNYVYFIATADSAAVEAEILKMFE